MKHIIAYAGLVKTSLGLMREEYMREFAVWANRREGIEGTLMRPPYSLASGVEWVQGLDKKRGGKEVFAVLLHTGDAALPYRYIGHTGLDRIEWPDALATTGSILGGKDARGHGCGTEAKLLLQYHAFRVLGLRKLVSNVKAFNANSLGHLLKCGYQIIGRHKAQRFHNGAFVDQIDLEVFRKDWEPIWERYQESKTLPRLTDTQRAVLTKQTTT